MKFGYNLHSISFDPVQDSSNIDPGVWVKMAEIIEDSYDDFDGFVILHGSTGNSYNYSYVKFHTQFNFSPFLIKIEI